MSYSISCGDVVPGCAAKIEADSHDELMAQVTEHARDEHGVSEVTPELAEQVEAAIKTG